MKSTKALLEQENSAVTPFAGVWIEIPKTGEAPYEISVTPFAGVWIEISAPPNSSTEPFVTPFAGVWIEIQQLAQNRLNNLGHSLRGSVD